MSSDISPTQRLAVVTGANKGIGLEICKQLASHGIMVILTARDEKRGIEALEKLRKLGLSDYLVFHQLDVVDETSIATLADFVKTQFGRLDILVNNAGIIGSVADGDTIAAAVLNTDLGRKGPIISNYEIQTYDVAAKCLQTNYYGPKKMIEKFIPLLQLSKSPRIVNVSSSMGKLKNIHNEWAKRMLNDIETVTEESIDDVVEEFLKNFKDGLQQEKGWPSSMSAYIVSKAALNAYTRVLANKQKDFLINCVCPGYVKTDLNCHSGILTTEEGAAGPVRLALLPDGGPSGAFFFRDGESSFE